MEIRAECTDDVETIARITQAAFAGAEHSSGTEAAIVGALRETGNLTISLVAVVDNEVVGHIAFSPVLIDGTDRRWYGLGPISVRPDHQRRGIGSALIREGLSRLEGSAAGGCVVLGNPLFYKRFDFACDSSLTFEGAPAECFMALCLAGERPTGPVTYDSSFY